MRSIEMKIDGKLCRLVEHYRNAVEKDYAVVGEDGLRHSSHGFRLDFEIRTGMRFRINGHDYEVVRGEDSWRCSCCGQMKPV